MPDHTQLKRGDRIRLLRVPDCDLRQREREVAAHTEDAGHTADTIERILRESRVLTITQIDEYGHPWFGWLPREPLFRGEEHSLTVLDDDSWEYAWPAG